MGIKQSLIRWGTVLGTIFLSTGNGAVAQETDSLHLDTIPVTPIHVDTSLRIKNLNPYITLHVDSTLNYKLEINRTTNNYFWYLKNAPIGLKINKDNGVLSFKADKTFFLSGKLRYDVEYKVSLGVENLSNPKERVDTTFTLVFYNTEIIVSKIKPSVNSTIYIDEGDTVSFRILCEPGSFPIETISMITSATIKNYTPVTKCNDDFIWAVPFDFIKEADKEKERLLTINFIGVTRFLNRDTATVKIYVRDAINYPFREREYNTLVKDINRYILQTKFTFRELDRSIKKTKNSRTTFDLASGTSALSGTVLSTSTSEKDKTAGKIMPSVGVALVPVKEAVSPVKSYEQNAAQLVRTSIKRLEYLLTDNRLVGEKDPDILLKTQKLKDEFKQTQVQLVDVPMFDTGILSEEELNQYFNNPKVNKKYKVSRK